MENCCCCPANCGELRPGLLVLMPDAMGLPPGFIGLLALAIGFPRTCKQRVVFIKASTSGKYGERVMRRGRIKGKTSQRGHNREEGTWGWLE